ncbi:MAG: sugar-binding transcriptional regulator [Anaerolineae bacterium]|jgi:DNA-binding transcriptional regulator LsrR (DeoR family)
MEQDDLLARIAWLYYIEDLTQKEIAHRFKMSRVKVTRLLKKAREKGLVEIRIANVRTSHLPLERSLRTEFGLSDAVVIPTPVRVADLRPALGKAAAAYLSRILKPGMQVGLGMGRTLAEIPDHLEPQESGTCHFIEMVGGIGRGLSFDSYKVSMLLAERCGGEVEHVYTPVIVETAAARQALLSDPQIRSVLDRASRSDIAMVSVGTVDLDSFLYHAGYSDELGIEGLQRLGAVGDVLGHFFDSEGQPVPNPIEDRLMGLSLDRLRGIPVVICAAGGLAKVPSILGALRGGHVNVLITDEDTACAILGEMAGGACSPEVEG